MHHRAPTIDLPILKSSRFRRWFKTHLPGRRVQWPQLLRDLIDEELRLIRKHGDPYKGNVFIDRDSLASKRASHHKQQYEIIKAYWLYLSVHKNNQGCLRIEDDDVWLISCQVPNQGNSRRRCADIVGLKKDGSLVLFECKEARNKDTPLFALLEGLDYLGHLLIPGNLDSFEAGFEVWRQKPRDQNSISQVPLGFTNVRLKRGARHSVIVLAPRTYFDFHRQDVKGVGQDWDYLSDRLWPDRPCMVGMDFAWIEDLSSARCELLPLD